MRLIITVLFCIQVNCAFGKTLNDIECFAEGILMKKSIESDVAVFGTILNDDLYAVNIYDKNQHFDINGLIRTYETNIFIAGSFDSTGKFFYSLTLSNGRVIRLICELN
jgi:hypothetical protein